MTEAKDAMNKGVYVEPSKTLYAEFMKSWLEDKGMNVRKSTFQSYTYYVNSHIVPALGHLEISKITPRDIQSFYNDVKSSGSLSSENLRKLHTIINDSLNKAQKWDMILRNPAALVDPPKVTKKEVEVWDEDDIKTFLDFAKNSRYYSVFLIALTTGMRRGEILGLRWKDIDEQNETLSVVQTMDMNGELNIGAKTSAGNRRISVDKNTLNQILRLKSMYKQELMANRPLYKNEHDLVIRTSVGTPLNPRNLNRIFYSLIKQSGVKRIRFHDLRHTHASLE
ncbi:tyrosine-type recombinase/integrase [Terribacillus aidingensis]|uniref:tyrosine-type recombinase/integrase n=1 Tax=Terribacillus aidingensis TaxID=586416 RepID=UPI001FE81AF3|nr:site-specific integrase [Terribacillus aidingensis]